MRMILKTAALAASIVTLCSCSWFGGKPVAATNRADASVNQAQQMQEAARAEAIRAEAMRAEAMKAEAAKAEAAKAEAAKAAAQVFRKEALTFSITADAQLNRFERNAHALFLCVYQLKDPNGFNQLAQERDGLPKLLECSRFDGSVANAKQFVVQPGEQMNEVRDRAEGARYIGLATGYYGTGKEKVTELCALLSGAASDPAGAIISIELGPYEISSVKVK